jgi:glycosyltransferase involved in cell wall biosynthesis
VKNLRKLLPGAKRDPKVVAVFSNRQADCDRLIRHVSRGLSNTPFADCPIYVYCTEQPYETRGCTHVVVDPDPDHLYARAQEELSEVWVALSATSWNGVRYTTNLKLIPLTIPPFRVVICNENGDFFALRAFAVIRHLIYRYGSWRLATFDDVAQFLNLRIVWPTRHAISWLHDKMDAILVWGTAVALAKLSWLAERIAPVTRQMYERLPKGQPAPLPPPVTNYPPVEQATSGITRIEYQGFDWLRHEICRLLRASESRFVLFCPSDYVDSLDDLLPLFDDPLTFAVSRQHGYREWREFLVALSPFRMLMPMEASRVAAPFARVVLVDRPKLMQLGIPNTLVFGAAWLLLFWRAGAAGWRSYSVGGRTPVDLQYDYRLEEMLFVKNLYRDPELGRIAIELPALCRGNIAFRPDLAKGYRALPRVLIVAPYLPFPLSHGGAVRMYNLCRALAEEVDFICICYREINDVIDYHELHRIFRQVYIVDRDEINTNSTLPNQINHYETSSMRALIADVARREEIDLLQIEYTDMAAYREAVPHRPAILVEHDVTYTLHRQMLERDNSEVVRLEYERWLQFETERLRAFDGVFVMSPQDQEEAVKSGANPERTFVVPNGVDLQRFRALPPASGEIEIFYVGSFRHLPNYLGFEELRVKIMPFVWNRFRTAKLRVVAGPEHEQHWRTWLNDAPIPQLDPRIIIHGFVSDLLPLYETAHIVVVPLPLSAGTNIKVMEAMACRRAIVTTPVGAQGLGLKDGIDALICGLGPEFAAAICRLIEDSGLREDIGAHARATAEARFGWDAIGRGALDAYLLFIRESGARHTTGGGSERQRNKEYDKNSENSRDECIGVFKSALTPASSRILAPDRTTGPGRMVKSVADGNVQSGRNGEQAAPAGWHLNSIGVMSGEIQLTFSPVRG